MTDIPYWLQSYRGGKMIDLPGFPRALYPPDAAPQNEASQDGPDVIAVKRIVSRLGRWPWQIFDNNYSNNFAHGKGPNVVDTGVAGVQRQARISPASGWVGEATFNFFRSVLVPTGLPHDGEYAMDALAQSLYIDAWDRFHGNPTPVPEPLPLWEAKKHIGVKERPRNSNHCMFTDWYGQVGPWCAMFVAYCYANTSTAPGTFTKGQYYAYVPYIVKDARNGKRGLSITTSPKPGDLACYDWQRDGTFDHIGIFEKWIYPGYFLAIEGNTSIDNDSNGGEVMRRTRQKTASVLFVRVNG